MAEPTSPTPDDPVLAERARMRALASTGQRIGYLAYAVATVLLFVGLATSFSGTLVWAIGALLIGGSIVLAVAIQLGYAVRGAERHEEDAIAQRKRR